MRLIYHTVQAPRALNDQILVFYWSLVPPGGQMRILLGLNFCVVVESVTDLTPTKYIPDIFPSVSELLGFKHGTSQNIKNKMRMSKFANFALRCILTSVTRINVNDLDIT